jgi:hypothetical protein
MALEQATLELDYVFAQVKVLLLDGLVVANQRLVLFDFFLQRRNISFLPLSKCALQLN